jgi:hypothetical protein
MSAAQAEWLQLSEMSTRTLIEEARMRRAWEKTTLSELLLNALDHITEIMALLPEGMIKLHVPGVHRMWQITWGPPGSWYGELDAIT